MFLPYLSASFFQLTTGLLCSSNNACSIASSHSIVSSRLGQFRKRKVPVLLGELEYITIYDFRQGVVFDAEYERSKMLVTYVVAFTSLMLLSCMLWVV